MSFKIGLSMAVASAFAAVLPVVAMAQANGASAAAAPVASTPATASPTSPGSGLEVWVNPGFYSIHFDRSKNLRADNIGLGAEVDWARDQGVMAGTFINSRNARAHYAAYTWRPLHWQPDGIAVSAGVAVGALDGYPTYHNGNWFVVPLPLLSVEGRRFGMNFTIIPNIPNKVDGSFTMQFKLRLW